MRYLLHDIDECKCNTIRLPNKIYNLFLQAKVVFHPISSTKLT